MNLRFIKPSQDFYNDVMRNWFKFLHVIEEERAESGEVNVNEQRLTKDFTDFAIKNLIKCGKWKEEIRFPLEKYC